jgi:hypothetical protein
MLRFVGDKSDAERIFGKACQHVRIVALSGIEILNCRYKVLTRRQPTNSEPAAIS